MHHAVRSRLAPVLALSVLALCAVSAGAVEQEETFTVPKPGADYVDGQKLSELVDKGDPRALNNIGWLYARGEGGVKQDFKEAMSWWKFSAKRGYTVAMNNVGMLYANGQGVDQSYEEAFKWWMRSAERGNAWAMNAVGDLYEQGQGVPQNYELALTWYREASREGDGLAFWNLGNLTEQGLGTERDPAEALRHYVSAAERNYAPGMSAVARLHATGTGTGRDLVEAYAWYAFAALRYTDETPQEAEANRTALQQIAEQLTSAQREAGDARRVVLDEKYKKPQKAPKPGKGESAT
ncbi:MAG: sel1 repeat family protein [Burkholderiales bacterium]|jgi:TPR repeat protein|nr:sel1 repeat family protein [Burkholderiales bacterium]